MGSRVLVTGATGFLGKHLCLALRAADNHVYAMARNINSTSELQKIGCEIVSGDLSDLNSLKKLASGMDGVFHLAGLVAYKKSERQAMEKVNVEGTRSIVQACLSVSIGRFVHVSSVAAIGASFDNKTILNENSPYNLEKLNLGYFETKRAAEEIVREAFHQHNFPAVIVNPSTIYGAGDGEKGSRKTQIKIAQGKFPFYTSGGVNVVPVEAVVSGILNAWHKGKLGDRYILAGENLYIKDLFSMIASCANVPAPKHLMPNSLLYLLGQFGDALNNIGFSSGVSSENAWTARLFHWFDSSKARKELDFNPGPAIHAIENSVRWMRDHGYLNK